MTKPLCEVTLSMWTVYDKPKDYPDQFVARRWIIGPGLSIPTADILLAPTLRELRAQLPSWMVRLKRRDGDDPCIVETWL